MSMTAVPPPSRAAHAMEPRSSLVTRVDTIWVPRPVPAPASAGMPPPSSATVTVRSSSIRSAVTSTVPDSRPARPCSTALVTSSVSTRARAVASSADTGPNVPCTTVRTDPPADATSAARRSDRPTSSSNTTVSSRVWDSVSCTRAIVATRRMASSRAARASGTFIRRACSRSSAATVCRLFFTRWWISRIVASLVMSSRSRRRSSDTSRQSRTAPMRSWSSVSGTARRDRATPCASMSVRHGARPMRTSGIDSSTVDFCSTRSATTSTSDRPTRSSIAPSRWKQDRAFGLAYRTSPSEFRRTRPSPTRGAPRRGPVAALGSGNSPRAIIAIRSSAAST
ncbi:hypothetical protein CHMI_02757 [Cellulomonas hominis]|nr:hypothetical protein CHMI_02757 [Cellulomonas hominis]